MPRNPACGSCGWPETRRVYTRAPRSQGGGFVPLGWECMACRRLTFDPKP